MRANVAERLLQHYVDNYRVLPWRSPPGTATPDPYRVWLSEVMLQQTTVASVTPRFERFVERWPSVESLAAAPNDDILSEWAGLGYYARARNLIACARKVVAKGGFPETEAELRRLPGIGDYTAAAVAAIAFGQKAAVVDSNVERVTARLHGFERPSKAQLRRSVEAITPGENPGDFAQAMMDLGATICRPKKPLCSICPLAGICSACALGDPERFPAPKPKRIRPVRFGTARWIERGGALWLVRRPPTGLLGGMAALPGNEWTSAAPADASPPLARVRHLFTHLALELSIVAAGEVCGTGWWQPLDRIADAGLPSLYRRAVDAVLSARMDRAA